MKSYVYTENESNLFFLKTKTEYYEHRVTHLQDLLKKNQIQEDEINDPIYWLEEYYRTNNDYTKLLLTETTSTVDEVTDTDIEKLKVDIKQDTKKIEEILEKAPANRSDKDKKDLDQLIKERSIKNGQLDTYRIEKKVKKDIQKAAVKISGEAGAILAKALINGDFTRKDLDKIEGLAAQLGIQIATQLIKFIPMVGPMASIFFEGFAGAFFGSNAGDPVLERLQKVQETLDNINHKLSKIDKSLKNIESNILAKLEQNGERVIQSIAANNARRDFREIMIANKSWIGTNLADIILQIHDPITTDKTEISRLLEVVLKPLLPESKEQYIPNQIDRVVQFTLGFSLDTFLEGDFSLKSYDDECYAGRLKKLMVEIEDVSLLNYVKALNDIQDILSSFIALQLSTVSSITACMALGSLKLASTLKELKKIDKEYITQIAKYHKFTSVKGKSYLELLQVQTLTGLTFDSEHIFEIYGQLFQGTQPFTYVLLNHPDKGYIDNIPDFNTPVYQKEIKNLESPWILRKLDQNAVLVSKKMTQITKEPIYFLNYQRYGNENLYELQRSYDTYNINTLSFIPCITRKDSGTYYVALKVANEGAEDNTILSLDKHIIQVQFHDPYQNIDITKGDVEDNSILFTDMEDHVFIQDVPYYSTLRVKNVKNNLQSQFYIVFEKDKPEDENSGSLNLYKYDVTDNKYIKSVIITSSQKGAILKFKSNGELNLYRKEEDAETIVWTYSRTSTSTLGVLLEFTKNPGKSPHITIRTSGGELLVDNEMIK